LSAPPVLVVVTPVAPSPSGEVASRPPALTRPRASQMLLSEREDGRRRR
jgi:hypothetical protein